jgi:Flp pilus assembly protein TadG
MSDPIRSYQPLGHRRKSRSSVNCSVRRHARCGATTVEFAIVVPIIFAMFLGAVEMTRLNFIRHSASNAAYEGARKAIVPGSSTADAQTEARRLMTALGVSNGITVTVTSTTATTTVTVSVPVNQNSWGAARFSSGMTITQTCTLSRESTD